MPCRVDPRRCAASHCCFSRVAGEAVNPSTLALVRAAHGGNPAIIEVDHGRAVLGSEAFDQFAFGYGDVLHSAEFAGMGRADARGPRRCPA